MIPLPLYIIEKIGSLWTLYQTDTCQQWEFETKEQAENYLNKLKL